jgi:hypothetical protein
MTTMPRVRDNETGELVDEPSPASPAVCIAEAAKEAIDMALATDDWRERDQQILRAIQQICYLRG